MLAYVGALSQPITANHREQQVTWTGNGQFSKSGKEILGGAKQKRRNEASYLFNL
ncbi:hypothetical protein KAM449_40460 [Aeromonas caviae]|uniref:Uncharacterized protein n=1 Tax=Aeromonas caviae TaxID=648 RepID=A0ABD0BE75_AERCA|nr:hypothetical protein KAM362_42060 [Aeromonas caviae]GJB26353.1 hypothetical protein KAM365_41030 [Aeromonas caviae]GJB61601.1 hypothetical protein KAM374_41370 [Aeromonas caviae]GJB94130.1 hypothetical protein KAM382_41910 [Aeromonas caviae]GKQ86299.1 hypothetical protein KAM449_40460 [Aeromonas caviae]